MDNREYEVLDEGFDEFDDTRLSDLVNTLPPGPTEADFAQFTL